MKNLVVSLMVMLSCSLFAQPIPDINAYIENPAMVAENQEPPHVPLVPFKDVVTAKQNDWDSSPYYRLLNGQWKFKWSQTPQLAPQTFFRNEYDTSDWDEIPVPSVWQMQGYGYNMYRNIPQALAPFNPPYVPDDFNPTGCYKRTFNMPTAWLDDRQIFLHFEGVKSASFVWVNGEYIGYDQGGMTSAEYNITDYIKSGSNSLAVMVIRWSDGSYLEDQDMWRFAGIYRDVYLFSTESIHIRDFFVRTELDNNYKDATLKIDTWLKSKDNSTADQTHLIKAYLYDASGTLVTDFDKKINISGQYEIKTTLEKLIKNPQKWSAEKPHLYTLLLELQDSNGRTIEVLTEKIGFRKLEIINKQALINGVAVDFMGVNRHEHHPKYGRTIPREMMVKDVTVMKQFNVNAVRTCHYPNDPEWYNVTDEYGIYVQDEVNAECHYSEGWLADVIGWEDAFMDRWTRMIQRDKNNPSIVMWSTGNECGLGAAHDLMAEYVKTVDPDRFLYHQSNHPNGTAPYVDIDGPRYPTPAWLRQHGQASSKPVVMGEYMHAMGNSLGLFQEFWDIIHSVPTLQGGYIWDWVDQGLELTLKMTPDRSSHQNHGTVMGNPKLVKGVDGKALSLSGLDDWIEIYNDPIFDQIKNQLTLEAWVHPAPWTDAYILVTEKNQKGYRMRNEADMQLFTMPFVTKASQQFGLQQIDQFTVEFFINSGRRTAVRANVPGDWYNNWHHLVGSYDGKYMTLYIDGNVVASLEHSGNIRRFPFPINIGRNSDTQREQYPTWVTRAKIDHIRIFNKAYNSEELNRIKQPTENTLLWLDFDSIEEKEKFYSYGSSPFCINGTVYADRSPQPEMWQVKRDHAPVRIKPIDLTSGTFSFINYHNFTNLNELDISWTLSEDDSVLDTGILNPDVPPRSEKNVSILYRVPTPKPGAEYWLTIDFKLASSTTWAEKGHLVTFEQFKLPVENTNRPNIPVEPSAQLSMQKAENDIIITGENFVYRFDTQMGTLSSIKVNGTELLASGPVLNLWRAPILNELSGWGNREFDPWWEMKLDQLEHQVQSISSTRQDNAIKIEFHVLSNAQGVPEGYESLYSWKIQNSGDIFLKHQAKPFGSQRVDWLPRLGIQLQLAAEFDQLTWYGRGPEETYPDRKTGVKLGVYKGTIEDQYVPYVVPQDYGNKTDVRWAALTNTDGLGLAVFAEPVMNISVTPYQDPGRAVYAFQLKKSGRITLNLDHKVTGVGGTPVPTRPRYRTYPKDYEYLLRFKPVHSAEINYMELNRQAFGY